MRNCSCLQSPNHNWMPRLILILVIICCFQPTTAQEMNVVDATIQLYPDRFDDVSELSAMISRDFITEEDKIRAIYGWIVDHVAYDPEEYKSFNYKFKDYRERNTKEEKTRKQIIARTLQKGVAVCEGYAMLFEKLCTDQGISNYLVRGDIKTNFNDIGRPFKKLHMWNIAFIDGEAYLFDPTWGAGRYNGKFIKETSWYFYKADPKHFVKTHYPDIDDDSLLQPLISRGIYQSWPIIIDQQLTIEVSQSPRVCAKAERANIDRMTQTELVSQDPMSVCHENILVSTGDILPCRRSVLINFNRTHPH